jgi:hypothetical protein
MVNCNSEIKCKSAPLQSVFNGVFTLTIIALIGVRFIFIGNYTSIFTGFFYYLQVYLFLVFKLEVLFFHLKQFYLPIIS